MKLNIFTAVAAVGLIAGSAIAFADDVTVTGSSKSPAASAEDKGTTACFEAFINKLFPANTARVRVEDRSGGYQIFTGHYAQELMGIEMTATLARSKEVLARGYCTVDQRARIARLSTHAVAPARLAGLNAKD
jgi:hypothetical protein